MTGWTDRSREKHISLHFKRQNTTRKAALWEMVTECGTGNGVTAARHGPSMRQPVLAQGHGKATSRSHSRQRRGSLPRFALVSISAPPGGESRT